MLNSSNKRVTHQDIATALGISQSTVSLALRNHPRISEAMRQKVQARAEALGYAPDPMLSALVHYRRKQQAMPPVVSVAWINLHRDPQVMHRHQEFVLYLKGATEAAREQGFQLEEFAVADLRPARLHTILKTRNIRGILLSPPDLFFEADWDGFPWGDYATVRLGRSSVFPPVHFVTSAQLSNAMMGVDAMSERGYQRIGFVTDYRRRRVFGPGFLWAQFEWPEEQQVPLLNVPREMTLQQKQTAVREWMERAQPDAVLSDIPDLPELLEQLGYRVPEDVALATTNVNESSISAGIDQKPEIIGQSAMQTLIALLQAQRFGIPPDSNEILVKGRWVDGASLPKRA